MDLGERGLQLLKDFEGLRLKAYQDSVGIWTIGYGTTYGVKEGMIITEEKASELLYDHCDNVVDFINKTVTVEISQSMFDALVCFVYNIGQGAFKKSTLLKKLNNGEYLAAADEFLKWNKAGGKVIAGLTRRRIAEQELFLEDGIIYD